MRPLVACAAILLASHAAHAGVAFEHSDIVYATPIGGAEYVTLGAMSASLAGVALSQVDGFGVAFGAHGGFRIGPIALGALYQRTQMFDVQMPGLSFNKVYGEASVNVESGIVIVVLSLAGGYAFYSAPSIAQQNGFGGRVGLGVDFYPVRWFSIGPGASADLMAYVTHGPMFATLAGSVGGTFALRTGFHL